MCIHYILIESWACFNKYKFKCPTQGTCHDSCIPSNYVLRFVNTPSLPPSLLHLTASLYPSLPPLLPLLLLYHGEGYGGGADVYMAWGMANNVCLFTLESKSCQYFSSITIKHCNETRELFLQKLRPPLWQTHPTLHVLSIKHVTYCKWMPMLWLYISSSPLLSSPLTAIGYNMIYFDRIWLARRTDNTKL